MLEKDFNSILLCRAIAASEEDLNATQTGDVMCAPQTSGTGIYRGVYTSTSTAFRTGCRDTYVDLLALAHRTVQSGTVQCKDRLLAKQGSQAGPPSQTTCLYVADFYRKGSAVWCLPWQQCSLLWQQCSFWGEGYVAVRRRHR